MDLLLSSSEESLLFNNSVFLNNTFYSNLNSSNKIIKQQSKGVLIIALIHVLGHYFVRKSALFSDCKVKTPLDI